ncbi:MAG: enoyl-CoA hydratase-related protein [Deltaproteobacteria bacterium]
MGTVAVERAGAVGTIRMNRPDRLNAYEFEMGKELLEAASTLGGDPAIRCIVLTGSGKAFCAGGDVAVMGTFREEAAAGFLELTVRLHSFIASLRRAPKPVLSAVNGVAAGAGFSMALAADFVIAAASARFTLAYQNIGLSPDGGATFFLTRAIGTHRAMELTLTGRTLSAEEAAGWGLVQRVVPDEALAATTQEMAQRIAAGPTQAFAKAKELYNRALFQPLETQMEEERQRIAASARTTDFREGIRAFLEKRPPAFRGE